MARQTHRINCPASYGRTRADTRSVAILTCWLWLTVAINNSLAESKTQWPSIRELSVTTHFDATAHRIFKQTIFGANGFPLYLLDARIPSDTDPYEGYYYSGIFDCRITAIGEKGADRFATLLQNVRNATRDWETDGRFLNTELAGLVGAKSSRVLLQRCKLRGMAITIEIGKVVKNDKTGDIQSFDASFSFKNDTTAVSDIAAAN